MSRKMTKESDGKMCTEKWHGRTDWKCAHMQALLMGRTMYVSLGPPLFYPNDRINSLECMRD